MATASPAGAQQAERDTAMGSQIAKHEGARISARAAAPTDGIQGIDVSSHQGEVDWAYWWGQGKRFAYVKATESHDYVNPYFGQQYGGSAGVGMKRGAYHFALPNDSTGATQANYFVDNGGTGRGTARRSPARSTWSGTRTPAGRATARPRPRWPPGSATSSAPTAAAPAATR